MKSVRFGLMTALAFGLPLAATAQQSVAKGTPSDIQYCAAMAKAYSSLFPAQEGMAASDVVLLSRCDTDTQLRKVVVLLRSGEKGKGRAQ